MPLLSVALAVLLMLVLVTVAKLDAFFALLLTSMAVGLLNGLGLLGALQSVMRGLGATLGGVTLILAFGAMLGALIDTSGAARVITERLTARFGRRPSRSRTASSRRIPRRPSWRSRTGRTSDARSRPASSPPSPRASSAAS